MLKLDGSKRNDKKNSSQLQNKRVLKTYLAKWIIGIGMFELTRMRWRPFRARRCRRCTSWGGRITVVGRLTARWKTTVWIRWIGIRVPGVLGTRRRSWRRLGKRALRLLLDLGFNLCENGRGVQPAAIKVAFVRQQILAVVFFQRVSSTGGGSDAQLGRDILPSFVLCAL